MKNYVPTYSANTIFEIDLNFFLKNKFKYLFVDLDNTLDGPHTYVPSLKTIDLFKKFKKVGLNVVVCSNNSKKRVSKYCQSLNCEYIYRAFKPFPYVIRKYMSNKKIDGNFAIIIGDQIATDIFCANKLKIKSILTNRLTNKDQIVTYLNRKIDEHLRKKVKESKLTKSWREVYVENK